jgi:hypothetical protein
MTTPIPEPTVRTTCYEVSCVPGDTIDADSFTIQVEYRGHDKWAVLLRRMWCLSVEGEWDYEPQPSSREDDWLATHRFDLDTALRLAKEQAPLIKVNGYTVADAIAMEAAR